MKKEFVMKVCFVVMGFGKKVEYETGRVLDLDATYEAIIEPAVASNGLRCIRADEITQSGIIDVKMYEMLLRADLVIADISTGNVNAVYELGVRHALRPNSTIIMTEDQGKLYFDLNHISTFQYQHFGDDILAREARRAVKDLGALIGSVMAAQAVDSPVYTYLPKLLSPRMSDEEYEELLGEAEEAHQRFSRHMREGEKLMRQSKHELACQEFAAAHAMRPGEPNVVQKLALNTYKSKQPTELEALQAGLQLIGLLQPEESNDPETVGIAGAISKRLWLLEGNRDSLDASIQFYRRGFEVKRDYYNGQNLAQCFEFRAQVQSERSEKVFDFMCAQKIREILLKSLHRVLDSEDFFERPDKRWIYATLANCHFACEQPEQAEPFEHKFLGAAEAQWEIETYMTGKDELFRIRADRLSTLSQAQA
ncbi:TRAFs-binding domain-containing protein [Pseudomonas abietaniphila]|uniref:TRAFs-binding domain-containing protein n=1 Tax=Pseudomonas abietaniphila TaxID=89065 RepID=UPI001EE6C588|nr:TRAFs-binding domain-containing protein [Pseudomonas abietaniphila]